MLFEYLYMLEEMYLDSFLEEYITHRDTEKDEYLPYGEWFSDMYMHQFSDRMLSCWSALRVIYSVRDYYETRLAITNGSNPTFQELLDSLKGEVGNPD